MRMSSFQRQRICFILVSPEFRCFCESGGFEGGLPDDLTGTDREMKIGSKILAVETCSSTNDLANALALEGEEEGTVIIAGEQTAGRGTRGRIWFSEKEKGLYLSVILRPAVKDLSLLPIVAGLAVKDALSETVNLPVLLKWPNDLMCKGKKLGGILCEASFFGNEIGHAVLGVGLNVNQDEAGFPAQIRSQSTSLKILLAKEFDVQAFLFKLWQILDDWYRFFREGKKIQIIRAFEESSEFSPGDRLTVIMEKTKITGEYIGIDLTGRLLLRTQGIERSFLAPEVHGLKKEIGEA
jgi:BirA family biotin operon repressor/biotin-[acetyl-CoA-carboxylase] ligase